MNPILVSKMKANGVESSRKVEEGRDHIPTFQRALTLCLGEEKKNKKIKRRKRERECVCAGARVFYYYYY